jgi:1-acyl-sn-glycerol-3-phosphate acyltransferase
VIQPTPEQWAVLTAIERFNYRLGDLFSQRFMWVGRLVARGFGRWFVWIFSGRRFAVTGQEHLEHLEHSDRLLVVANHRSFFDFYVVLCLLWLRSRAPLRIVMPVRSPFFYDTLVGPLVNLAMSGYSMFPPILRDRARGAVFNRFSQDRIVEELDRPGTVMGMHPEGRRNKGDDPYTFLPARPGTGRLLRKAKPGVVVLPVFVTGITNSALRELYRNWFAADRWPIDLVFGAPIDISDLCQLPDEHGAHMKIVERCMEAIAGLAERHRTLRPIAAEQGTR